MKTAFLVHFIFKQKKQTLLLQRVSHYSVTKKNLVKPIFLFIVYSDIQYRAFLGQVESTERFL